MSDIFAIQPDGTSVLVPAVRCSDEERELQRTLESNLDLLPGDQIDPDDPRRWLLIRREMPVPSPSTGTDLWNIDFLLCDQDAMPTFVECKRHDDTRARREVVGQMLDYVANGQHYWTAEELLNCASAAQQRRRMTVEAALAALKGTDGVVAADFFKAVQENLAAGRIRLIFFLEESSNELRSIVQFLNSQMERTEVLIVELRQYNVGQQRIAVPTLFGFTERARALKRAAAAATERRNWTRATFMEALTPTAREPVMRLINVAEQRGWNITHGTGKVRGSLSLRIPGLSKRSLFTVFSDGQLVLNFGWLNESAGEEALSARLSQFAAKELQANLPDDWQRRYVGVEAERWMRGTSAFIEFLEGVAGVSPAPP